MPKPKKARVLAEAPIASGDPAGYEYPAEPDRLPAAPPVPLGRRPPAPVFRPLRVYTFGPTRGRARGNIQTILVPYEKLAPGPVGERVAVVDWDATRSWFYDPVDLDQPHLAMTGGLEPSESDPQFHQQMAYAVVSDALHRIEVALGRTVTQRTLAGSGPFKIIVYPHFYENANAHSIGARIMCGYFRADSSATGRVLPGQTVFTCLSQDVVGHQVTHVVHSAQRPDLYNGGSVDNRALLEALADMTPLLFHFTNREIVFDTVERTAGVIYRSQVGGQGPGSEPRIVAELASDNPLLSLSGEFGDAIGRVGGIRSALLAPDPKAFENTTEPHDRGAILVAALFDAMFSVYEQRTRDLFRINRSAGGRQDGSDLPEALVGRLCDEIAAIAMRFFGMCWRGLDYCPPIQTSAGDFLRACITADSAFDKNDGWGVRDALLQAFRVRGITATSATFFSEEALRWSPAGDEWPVLPVERSTEDALPELTEFVRKSRKLLGIRGSRKVDVYPLQASRSTSTEELPRVTLSTQIVTGPDTGFTIVFDDAGKVRHAIPASRIEGRPKP